MKKTIINQNQKGFLFKNGKYIKLLDAGKYCTSKSRKIEISDLDKPIISFSCSLDDLITDPCVADKISVIEVRDNQRALHFVNGNFAGILSTGKHAFWSIHDKHEFTLTDVSTPAVDPSVPEYIFAKAVPIYYTKIEVPEYMKARIYFNKKLETVLDPGTYYFWRTNIAVEAELVDTRLTQMDISGQEMLTQDKVTVRINFVCNYRITDCVKIVTEIDNYKDQLHIAAQLALREFVGKHRLDEILENKDKMSEHVFQRLKEKQEKLFVDITDAGVKDIILPGEIRDIMNTVLIAEKRAQANVITRREEVASTRSLLNTAKLMDENKTLYKLKELEYIERICENVGNISLHSNGDILSQLTGILRSDQ